MVKSLVLIPISLVLNFVLLDMSMLRREHAQGEKSAQRFDLEQSHLSCCSSNPPIWTFYDMLPCFFCDSAIKNKWYFSLTTSDIVHWKKETIILFLWAKTRTSPMTRLVTFCGLVRVHQEKPTWLGGLFENISVWTRHWSSSSKKNSTLFQPITTWFVYGSNNIRSNTMASLSGKDRLRRCLCRFPHDPTGRSWYSLCCNQELCIAVAVPALSYRNNTNNSIVIN